MSKLHVLFADLKSELLSRPYQLGLLASYALTEPEVARQVRFSFTEHPQRQPASTIAAAILDGEADLVAISHYAWNHTTLCRTLDLLTASNAKLPYIVLGGANCAGRFGVEMMKRYPIISAVVEGEGEPAFKDICAALADSPTKNPFVKARNCRFRDKSGETVALNLGHRLQNLDDVPSPYLTGVLPIGPPPVFYETNRGCPYRCAFCYWGVGNSRVYRLSYERIREEMTAFAERRISDFILADANFGIFESDVEIALLMAELNARHGHPFKFVGVNYAKNSSERVLQISSILHEAKIHTTTTLALQSVSPEAEKQSKRYAIPPSRFGDLVRAAYARDIATYTDLILGLPGESIEEFIDGLVAVISTGIPAMRIHQLSLLPGTEFYDKQEEFGLITMAGSGAQLPPGQKPSAFWDFLVHSHPKLSHTDLERGLRMSAINHLMHNHNLGRITNFYLARHGVPIREVYEFFDDLVTGRRELEVSGASHDSLPRLRELIVAYSEGRLDLYSAEVKLSMEVWFASKGIRGEPNAPNIRSLMRCFYRAFCERRNLQLSPEEWRLLMEVIDFNMLVAPKPRWTPAPMYLFEYDISAIWTDMLQEIISHREKEGDGKERWTDHAARVAGGLRRLLSDAYLAGRRGPVCYTVDNPMILLPPRFKFAWSYTAYDWYCRLKSVDVPAAAGVSASA